MPKRFKSALVTGGAGFIGSHIVDALVSRRVKVYVADDLSTGYKSNINPNAKFFQVSINSPEFIKLCQKIKPELIIHAAAQTKVGYSVENPREDAKTNIFGTINVIEAGVKSGVKKFIFLSTGGAIYPPAADLPVNEKMCVKPISPYGISKRAAELYFVSAYEIYGVPYAIMRPSNIIGPRQRTDSEGGVVSIFANKMLSGESYDLYGDGKQTRDYVYISDVVRAVLLAAEKPIVGTFNISTGKETSVNEIIKKLQKITESKMPPRRKKEQDGEMRRNALDPRWAASQLGWRAEVKLDDGIKRIVEWLKGRQ